MTKYNALIFVLFLFTFGISTQGFDTVKHEEAHQQIFALHGVNSTIKYDFLWLGGETIPDSDQFGRLSIEEQDQVNYLNSQNEIVGYPSEMVVIMLSFIASCLIMLTLDKIISE